MATMEYLRNKISYCLLILHVFIAPYVYTYTASYAYTCFASYAVLYIQLPETHSS